MPIPLVAFEEHYEAFFVWHHARRVGWLEESANWLLHVDEHDDLRLPVSREALPDRDDVEATARYTYRCLNISSFIWPTVHAGLFDRYDWLRRRHDASTGQPERIGLSFDPQRTWKAWRTHEAPAEIELTCTRIEPSDSIRTNAPVALDIDLDYFAVNAPEDRPLSRTRLEPAFAQEVLANPYHWMRVEGYPFRVEQQPDGNWVLVPVDELPRRKQRPQHDVEEALDRFAEQLDRSELKPALITICRSEYSGSTPAELTLQIETGLRRRLAERYDLEEHSLNALLPDPWKIPADLLRRFPW